MAAALNPVVSLIPRTAYRSITADGVEVFFREAGPKDGPVLLLLHGFPTSSHMFRELIPLLATRFRVIAPDLPGFGFTAVPEERGYRYSFDSLAQTIGRFTEEMGIERYGMYVFDYGAPVGFRLAVAHPERVSGIVSQNGNAYEEGLSEAWNPIQRYWKKPTAENREALRGMLTMEGVKQQYTHGIPKGRTVAPEAYTLDEALLQRPGNAEIQLDLFLDYASNVALYPRFQAYLRERTPRLLAIWGEKDPFFLPAGAEAFRRDVPGATVRLLPTGHFALETHVEEIAAAIQEVMDGAV